MIEPTASRVAGLRSSARPTRLLAVPACGFCGGGAATVDLVTSDCHAPQLATASSDSSVRPADNIGYRRVKPFVPCAVLYSGRVPPVAPVLSTALHGRVVGGH